MFRRAGACKKIESYLREAFVKTCSTGVGLLELLISEFTCTVLFLIKYPIFVDVQKYESSLSFP